MIFQMKKKRSMVSDLQSRRTSIVEVFPVGYLRSLESA